jgi:Serine/threonine protein kinase
LVVNKETREKLVAKKILLTGMSEKEIQGSYQEAELLKRLQHPNIVSYKDSFYESGLLIIIMEYCEVGDLAYHVKQKNTKGEYFTEAEIMNWFVQICMSLQYIHRLGVLHRDIKSSNIYLTGNNTVKLGDFGISRILQGSEAAMTVVGTPYYMSPEVCEGKPYSYKSDA